jgi:ribosome biogenesis GTPase
MNRNPLNELGWQPFFEQQVSELEFDSCFVARVCAHHGSHVILMTVDGEIQVASSLLEVEKQEFSTVAGGDWFLLDPKDHRAQRRLDRKTELARKAAGEKVKPQLIAANVDAVFVVTSCNQDFNLSRIERYLALILDSGVTPVVVLTKADLHDDPVGLSQLAQSLRPGLIVETLDARDPEQVKTLEPWCGVGSSVALLGSSGVGKSTLTNSMGDFKIETQGIETQGIETQGIRSGDDKGRHTTTARSMHRLSAGGWLIDNPGIRELQLPACEEGVAELFDDIIEFGHQCKFRDCSHIGDDGCAIAAAVESGEIDQRRFVNYQKLQAEQAHNAATLAERRAKFRKFGRDCKKIMEDKKTRKYGR